ncbi:MAG TPA: biotin/lipoyl-binding protein [Roseiflexaceae bacterium]|nr:biotin/lipoyl-binding protein [Roseiflexaceae bacterium]
MQRALFRLLICLVAVSLLGSLSACAGGSTNATSQEATPGSVAGVDQEPVVVDAKIVPMRSAEIRFQLSGTLEALLVKEGDRVEQGTPIGRLDTRDLELQVARARVVMTQAQAAYDKLVEGATPEERAVAQASVNQASAQLRQAKGAVTSQDIAAARAQLEQARATLARLEAGPKSNEVEQARARRDQANANLQLQRDQLSATKTGAELKLEQATSTLTQAQSAYATAKQNWEFVQDTGNNPTVPEVTDPRTGQKEDNKVSDGQRQQVYDTYVQAEAQLRSAETAVEQALVAFENARKAEVEGIKVAEAQSVQAQAALDQLLEGADADAISGARAQVAQAQAKLQQLQGDQRVGSVDAAAATLEKAQADLERIGAAPRGTDLTLVSTQVQSAEIALQQAELALDKATLKAPFAGTIVDLDLDVGELAGPTQGRVVIADLSQWKIETDDLNELSVVRITVGSPVTITFDALPELSIPGKVTDIDLQGMEEDDDVMYTVSITPEKWNERLRWNMTASVTIAPTK